MIRPKKIALLLLLCLFACGGANEEAPEQPAVPIVTEYGTVSGTVTHGGTQNPIPGAIVTLLEQSMETGIDGVYTFQGTPYADSYTLVVEDADYQRYEQSFALRQERLVLNVALMPLRDTTEELQEFLDAFSALLESLDIENLEKIEALFSETYVAADDEATLFGVLSGIIPENYADVIPAITQLFEEYVSLEFLFKNVQADVTHARKASVVLALDVTAEKGEQRDLREIKARCQFDFRREQSDWKIVHWQLFEIDIRL